MASSWFPACRDRPRTYLLALAGAAGLLGTAPLISRAVLPRPVAPPAPSPAAPVRAVTALARLVPMGEIRSVAEPLDSAAGGQVRIRDLLVEERVPVRRDQVLAVLDNGPRLVAAVQEAEAQLLMALTRGQVAIADRRSQEYGVRARVERIRAEMASARADEARYASLPAAGALSSTEYESRRLRMQTVAAELEEAVAALARLRTRPLPTAAERRAPGAERGTTLDVAVVEREVQLARAALGQARSERKDSLVRGPNDGRVLTVLHRVGETPGSGGPVEIGQTARMEVVAENYHSDAPRVRPAAGGAGRHRLRGCADVHPARLQRGALRLQHALEPCLPCRPVCCLAPAPRTCRVSRRSRGVASCRHATFPV